MLLLETDKNPVFTKIPGALCAGTSSDNTTSKFSVSSENNNQSDVSLPTIPIASVTTTGGKRQKVQLQLFETEETKNLGNAELQRLVLLEQLQLIRMQKEKESLMIEKLKKEKEFQIQLVNDDDNTFFEL